MSAPTMVRRMEMRSGRSCGLGIFGRRGCLERGADGWVRSRLFGRLELLFVALRAAGRQYIDGRGKFAGRRKGGVEEGPNWGAPARFLLVSSRRCTGAQGELGLVSRYKYRHHFRSHEGARGRGAVISEGIPAGSN